MDLRLAPLVAVLVLSGCSGFFHKSAPLVQLPPEPVQYAVAQVGDAYDNQFVVCTECGVPTPKTLMRPVQVYPTAMARAPLSLSSPPVVQAPAVSRESKQLEFPVYFRTASSRLDVAAVTALEGSISAVKDAAMVKVDGYTDSSGAESFNDRLAKRRATAVATWLVAHGVPRSRVVVSGNGGCCYAASNTTNDGRRINRRAVISIKQGEIS